MTARAMKCISADKHPNADTLFVYEFEAGSETLRIVANGENVYSLNDIVAVVKAPAILKDNTEIKISSLRGVRSFGMALGKTEAPLGTDLSEEFCIKAVKEEGVIFKAWPKITSLYNVFADIKDFVVKPIVTYNSKIKLDGTNAGVHLLSDGTVSAQSRSRILSIGSDNFGFAAWVCGRDDYFKSIISKMQCERMIIYGEFAGPGIQKRASIAQAPRRILAVFTIQIDDMYETDPVKIKAILGDCEDLDIYVLPWEDEGLVFDFNKVGELESLIEGINKKVDWVEDCDPWVFKNFGIKGLGEGLVYYPVTDGTLVTKTRYSEYAFKAKGEKHKVVNNTKPVSLSPATANSIQEFTNLFVTINRLEQIYTKIVGEGTASMKMTGDFVKAFCEDVQSECGAELGASGMDWKMVSKSVNGKAVGWWKQKLDQNLKDQL